MTAAQLTGIGTVLLAPEIVPVRRLVVSLPVSRDAESGHGSDRRDDNDGSERRVVLEEDVKQVRMRASMPAAPFSIIGGNSVPFLPKTSIVMTARILRSCSPKA